MIDQMINLIRDFCNADVSGVIYHELFSKCGKLREITDIISNIPPESVFGKIDLSAHFGINDRMAHCFPSKGDKKSPEAAVKYLLDNFFEKRGGSGRGGLVVCSNGRGLENLTLGWRDYNFESPDQFGLCYIEFIYRQQEGIRWL